MANFTKQLGAALLGVALLAPAAQAQFFRPGYGRAFPSAQGMYGSFVPTQLQQNMLQNWAFNTATIGRTYASIPPFVFGYNPYPPVNFGPAFMSPSLPFGGGGYTGGYGSPAFGGGYMGGLGNPYGGGYSAGYPNASYGSGYGGLGGLGGGYSAGYNPYYNPYAAGSNSAGYLYGSSSVINAYGQLTLQQEQARLMREMALQAKLDTKKKRFDTLKYIRDHTPTFSQEQAKINREILQRIQTSATPPEIWSGKSLNIILKNLTKYASQKSPIAAGALDEDVIKHLNVAKKYGNLGLLRNNGQFTWPAALQGLVAPEEQANINKETQRLFRQAANAQVDANTLGDLRGEIEKLRTKLTANVNGIRQTQYMEAKRFLYDFDDALNALENGDATAYLEFQSQFGSGAKSVQEVVNYMQGKGLHFAPATSGDEAAYQALHDALVAWSVGLENHVASNASGAGASKE